jgi:type I pantothenate kinase
MKAYDIIPERKTIIGQPDIVIVEGLNVLQPRTDDPALRRELSSLTFSISRSSSDAREEHNRQWYVDRFLTFQKTIFQTLRLTLHRYARLRCFGSNRDRRADLGVH